MEPSHQTVAFLMGLVLSAARGRNDWAWALENAALTCRLLGIHHHHSLPNIAPERDNLVP